MLVFCERSGQYTLVADLPGDGASLMDGGLAVAVVNREEQPGRRRATAAHELGHMVLGDEYSPDLAVHLSRGDREGVVNAFASELLLPLAAFGSPGHPGPPSVRRANGPAVPVPVPAPDRATYVLATGQPSSSPGEARPAGAASSPADMAPHFLGAAPPPDPPTGWGAVVLTSSFRTSVVQVGRITIWSPHSLSTWTPPPVVRIDGRHAPASWSTWWYPLPPGTHTIDAVEPAAAWLRVEVAAGTTQYVHCRARVHVRRDHTDLNVIGQRAEVTLRPDRPRVGRSRATRTRVLA